MVSNKLMLRELYFESIKLLNYNNIESSKIMHIFYLFKITFKTNINNDSVLKYHGDIMMRCPEGDYSVIK